MYDQKYVLRVQKQDKGLFPDNQNIELELLDVLPLKEGSWEKKYLVQYGNALFILVFNTMGSRLKHPLATSIMVENVEVHRTESVDAFYDFVFRPGNWVAKGQLFIGGAPYGKSDWP